MQTPGPSPTITVQRLEGAAVAVAAAIAFVSLGHTWWWLLALFLVFDVSAIGYLAGPRVGAATYNAAHSFVGPALAGAAAIALDSGTAGFIALVWAFHIGVDRALGYGLKEPDAFHHTHLGPIGKGRQRQAS